MTHIFQYNKFLFFTTTLCLFLLVSCAKKEAFQSSVVVPSASGMVKVKKDGNNNYSIHVSVKDLTPPENLTPSKKTYVVWNEGSGSLRNIGQLNTSRSILARGYKATLKAVSTSKPDRVFITAEDDPQTQFPSYQVVLTTGKF